MSDFKIVIEHDGVWPTKWRWVVRRSFASPDGYASRSGYTFTKDRALKAALKAKRSIENDDVILEDVP